MWSPGRRMEDAMPYPINALVSGLGCQFTPTALHAGPEHSNEKGPEQLPGPF
jgi:hypothetical protein